MAEGATQTLQMSRDELRRAYRRMKTIRLFEERVEKEFALGNIPGFAHVYIGQEASGVGICH
ncbi:MAG: ABC transporter substrate-binding protein, partial [Alphaproteobacteria bacterium]|nr:ABC transporter substrate-binding protein [Alphaproteobacteria bacterium]